MDWQRAIHQQPQIAYVRGEALVKPLRAIQPTYQESPRTGHARADEDREGEEGVGWACASVERDSSADHGNRKSYKEGDEQVRVRREAVLGRRCSEHEARGPLVD